VKTVVDLKQLRDNFGLREDALRHIDRALEVAGEPTAAATPPAAPAAPAAFVAPAAPVSLAAKAAPMAPSEELSQLSLENLLSISTVTVSGNTESRANA